jgi:uncharacterized protein (TIGR00369 family)
MDYKTWQWQNHTLTLKKEGILTRPDTDLQSTLHPLCVVCSERNPHGLGLKFTRLGDDSVKAEFLLDDSTQGYTGMPHGGVIASVLDGAMTNWLLMHGIAAVTIELNVQYRHIVALNRIACVQAQLKETTSAVYVLKAQIRQDEQIKARAMGKFVCQPDLDFLERADYGT